MELGLKNSLEMISFVTATRLRNSYRRGWCSLIFTKNFGDKLCGKATSVILLLQKTSHCALSVCTGLAFIIDTLLLLDKALLLSLIQHLLRPM